MSKRNRYWVYLIFSRSVTDLGNLEGYGPTRTELRIIGERDRLSNGVSPSFGDLDVNTVRSFRPVVEHGVVRSGY